VAAGAAMKPTAPGGTGRGATAQRVTGGGEAEDGEVVDMAEGEEEKRHKNDLLLKIKRTQMRSPTKQQRILRLAVRKRLPNQKRIRRNLRRIHLTRKLKKRR